MKCMFLLKFQINLFHLEYAEAYEYDIYMLNISSSNL